MYKCNVNTNGEIQRNHTYAMEKQEKIPIEQLVVERQQLMIQSNPANCYNRLIVMEIGIGYWHF